MVELDDIEYTVNSAEVNAQNMVSYINTYCSDRQIKNSRGEVINIDANTSNPLYMILLGVGYLLNIVQRLVYNLGCQFNLAACSDKQLKQLGDIAGIKQKEASATIINCVAFSDEKGCTIPVTATATVITIQGQIKFHPAYEVIVAPRNTTNLLLVAEELGTFTVPANSVTEFDDPIEGLTRIESQAGIPGQPKESISSYRLRMQRREAQMSQIDLCMQAMEALDGVSRCNIYFNYSVDTPSTGEAGITIAPRTALLSIQGYNEDIPEVFYSYMICETQNDPGNPRFLSLDYTTRSGQKLPVHFCTPVLKTVYVRGYTENVITATRLTEFQSKICLMATDMTIGGMIDDASIFKHLEKVLPLFGIQYVEVSLNGIDWVHRIQVKADELLVFDPEKVTLEASV